MVFSLYAKDLYVETFTRFFDCCLRNYHKEGDTIYIKQVFGITEYFPSKIEEFPIRIINELNIGTHSNSESGRCKLCMFYIYPAHAYVIDGVLYMQIKIKNDICLDESFKQFGIYPNIMHAFYYKYNEETEDIEFVRRENYEYTGPTPWLIK